jgi:peptide/nickel transport system substrate-binding protein
MTHTRRTFLVAAAGTIGGVALAACSPPAPSAAPTASTSGAQAAPATSVAAPTVATSSAATPVSAAPPTATAGTSSGAAPTSAPAPASRAAPTTGPASTSGDIKRGGQIVYADAADPKSMDPAFITNRNGARVLQMLYDPLIDLDAESNLVPALAESWEISSDAKTITLKLRQGVKFHDGTDFDAAAVKVHFDRHLDPASKSLRTGELAGVASVEAVDTNTFRIQLKAPNPQFLYFLIDWNAFIESPTALKTYGADYASHPVGTGPFKFVEYAQDDHTLLERNPTYWDTGKPYVDSLKFRVIPVDATRLIELQSGGAQVIQDAPLQDIQRLSTSSDVKLDRRLGGRFSIWSWNIGHSPYADNADFRQAVNWALDRQGLLQAVYFGTGRISFAPYHAGTPFDDPTYRPFERNLDKARQLLQSAQANGLPSPASFPLYTGPMGVYPKLVQIIQANLAEIGVNVDIQQEADAAYNARIDRNDWHWYVYSGGWSWRPDPSLFLRNLFHSASTYTLARVYKDADVDRLIEQGEQETALDKRKALYSQLADKLNQIGSSTFAYQEENVVAISPKLQGWAFRADGKHHFQSMWPG